MTHEEHTAQHGVRQEEDRISTPQIVAVGIASLLVFAVAGAIVARHWHTRMSQATPPPIPVETGRSKIGLVEQQLFDVATRGQRDRATRLERLGSFGWVDRPAGVAHVPIDLALQLTAKGVRAAGGPHQQERTIGGQP